MTIIQSILLGIIQGLTEFLPVSSSGHLVLAPYLLNWNIPAAQAFVFDVLVQVATLAGVFAYFWRDLATIIRCFFTGLKNRRPFETQEARLGWYLILATIPAGLFGLLVKDAIEAAFSSPVATAVSLLVTAGLLTAGERIGRKNRSLEVLTWKDALWMGGFQALSVFPGVSRSGSTITGGMARDLERPAAARFSFLMSIPIMLAAGLLAALDMLELPNLGSLLPVMIPGFITAAITGYLAIRWLIGYLTRHSLYIFAAYCVLLSLLVLAKSYLA
jgi:undecaprenyl-diphosphatase